MAAFRGQCESWGIHTIQLEFRWLLYSRGFGLWIGIISDSFVQATLLALITSLTNWQKQVVTGNKLCHFEVFVSISMSFVGHFGLDIMCSQNCIGFMWLQYLLCLYIFFCLVCLGLCGFMLTIKKIVFMLREGLRSRNMIL